MRGDAASGGNGRYWHRPMPANPRPAGRISSSAHSATPFSASSFATARGAANGCPPRVATCLRPTISRTPTRGRSAWRSSRGGISGSWRRRSSSGSRSGRSSPPAAPSRSGATRATPQAVETAIELCREGHIVVMFPEGTRREKGLRKKHTARWRSGAARIALEAGVPLVPAGIAGTDELSRLGALRVAYGEPIELGDLGSMPLEEAAQAATDRLTCRDHGARGLAVVKPLLAVDGDSFAHRAFHALPRSFRRDDGGPANALIGFMSMLLRLWEAEQPAGRRGRAGTRSARRRTGTSCSRAISRAGTSIPRSSSSSTCCRGSSKRPGSSAGKADGFEADDFLAAAVAVRALAWRYDARRHLRPRRVPARGRGRDDPAAGTGGQRAAAHRARGGARALRRRAGARSPTSSRCVAIRPTRSPAPAASGRRPPRRCSTTYPDLDAMLAAGRFQAEAEQLARLPPHRDRSTPPRRCPTCPITSRTGTRAPARPTSSACRASPRACGRLTIEPRQPSGDGAPAPDRAPPPSRDARSGCVTCSRRSGPSSRAAARAARRSSASTTRTTSTGSPSLERSAGSTATRSVSRRPTRRRGSPPAARSGRSSSAASRSSGRRGTTPSTTGRWASASSATSSIAARHAQAELGLERVAIVDWDVHHGNGTEALVRGDESILFVSLHQWPFYPGHRRPGDERRQRSSTSRSPAGSGDARLRGRVRDDRRAGGSRLRAGAPHRLGRLRRPRRRSARRHAGHRGRVPRAWPPAARSSRRASPPCSRAATTSRRCRASSRRRSTASRPSH